MVVWTLSAVALSLATLHGAAEVVLGRASGRGQDTGAQAWVTIWCGEGRPSQGSSVLLCLSP